ncbi:MAG: urea carboxylase-associated family protein [Burkholderiales bacterium]|nr:urea carboxylase-associated family protein [Phycisphaerae bacterium]
MPTIPVTAAHDVPADIERKSLIWDETLAAGEYTSRVLRRGSRLRMINKLGDACAQFLAYNADRPIERLNVADTVKVQWNAYLGEGKLLLSDMGRVLMSITRDTCGRHDTFCGASSEWSNTRLYGEGANHSPFPSARDRFLLALQKYGLGKKDIAPSISFFRSVRIHEDGSMHFVASASAAGQVVELRAEMNVLVIIANCPHVLDPNPQYTATPLRVIGYRGPVAPADDSIRNAGPENQRAFENTDDYFLD